MPNQLSMEKERQIEKEISQDRVGVCKRCNNAYFIIWVKHSRDYNDFGLRHCPFCGLLTDELTGNVMI